MTHEAIDPSALGARLSDAVIMFHEAVAATRGLSAADHKALGILERHGAMSAGDLADRTGLTPGAITGLVDRLHAAGYVRREPDPGDRRRIILRAVAEPSADVLGAFAVLKASQADFSSRYTPTQIAAITDWVTRISDELDAQTHALGAGNTERGNDRRGARRTGRAH